jgi:hypothetical protein
MHRCELYLTVLRIVAPWRQLRLAYSTARGHVTAPLEHGQSSVAATCMYTSVVAILLRTSKRVALRCTH